MVHILKFNFSSQNDHLKVEAVIGCSCMIYQESLPALLNFAD